MSATAKIDATLCVAAAVVEICSHSSVVRADSVLTSASASAVESVAMVYVTITPSARRRRAAAAMDMLTRDLSTPALSAIASMSTASFSSRICRPLRPENVMSPVTTGAAVGLGTGATVGNGVETGNGVGGGVGG